MIDLVQSWAPAATPPPLLTVSEWADAERRLPQSSGAQGSRWRTSATPYLRGIMDAAKDPTIRKIACRKCAQVGGSEAITNILGYFIAHEPCPILLVQPTISAAEEWSKERLEDLINTTPAIRDAVNAQTSTLDLKMFPGGFLALGGANTPNTFRRRAVRLAIGDDVDGWPAVVGDEGDPSDLLVKRTTTFYDGLTIWVSTPTLKGGRIDTLYERSDQRRYMVACPNCQHEDWITWSDVAHFRVGFDERDPATARLECPACEAYLDEAARRRMVADGEWKATAETQESGLVGFHLPAMVTTLGNASLSVWVSEWLSARQLGKESTRVFINTTLGEGWEDRGAKMDSHALITRREDYGARPDEQPIEVPQAAVVLTAGVDVQADRFELQVIGWGPAAERWVVDWRTVPGDPKKPETHKELLDALGRRYLHASGHQLAIKATCIDTGYATDEIYDFVLAHQARGIYATKGYAKRSGEPIVGKPSEKRYGSRPRPVRLYPINVDDAKRDVLNCLTVVEPGPGAMHFPIRVDTVDEEYFAQLCAEHRETVYNKGGVATHTVWVLDRERNEALDTAVLALAAFKRLNPNLNQLAELLAVAPSTKPA